MEKFKKMLPALLMILFELAVGVLLLIDPERFTTAVFITFGIVLIVCAILMLIRYLRERKAAAEDTTGKSRASTLTLIASITTFLFGAVFAFGSSMLYGITGLLLVFYGAVMIVKGIFKIADYFTLKSEGFGASALRLVIGILSILVGGLIVFNPFGALDVVFTVAGVYLIVEAVLDIIALILSARLSKTVEVEVKDIDDEPYDLDNFAE